MNTESNKNLLHQSTFFGQLGDEQLDELARITQRHIYQKGQVIFTEGTPAVEFVLIIAGQVKIVKYAIDGREQILHIFGPNQPVGEVAVFLGGNFPAHCITLTEVEIMMIKRVDFIELVQAKPQLALEMLAILAQRLQIMGQLITDLSADAPSRLAKYLLTELAKTPGQTEIRLPISKSELAKFLGMTPETLSRVLNRFKKNGVLESKGRWINISDPQQLNLFLNME
jgi:CRP/FNR family transcriptional regulator, dissimilatory nitrate respiration regulator